MPVTSLVYSGMSKEARTWDWAPRLDRVRTETTWETRVFQLFDGSEVDRVAEAAREAAFAHA